MNGIRMLSLARTSIYLERHIPEASILYGELISNWMKRIVQSTFWAQQGKVVFEFAIFLSLGLVVYFSQINIFGNYFDAEGLIIIGAMSIKLLPGLNALSNSIQGVFANWSLAKDILFPSNEKKVINYNPKGQISVNFTRSRQKIKKIELKYSGNSFYTQNLWVEVEGPTGCGKTTFINNIIYNNDLILDGKSILYLVDKDLM